VGFGQYGQVPDKYVSFWMLTTEILIALGDPDVLYQLGLHQQHLCRLCNIWQSKVHSIPSHSMSPQSWGPTEEELMDQMAFEISGSFEIDEHGLDDADCAVEGMGGDEMDESSSDDFDEDYGELLEACEAFGLVDEYRGETSTWKPSEHISTPSFLPQKRYHHEL
jgi:hypothetical protein